LNFEVSLELGPWNLDSFCPTSNRLAFAGRFLMLCKARIWWNWQTRYFEVVVGQPVQVQVLLSAPLFQRKLTFLPSLTQF
jgi:hypothetical protein